MLITFEGGEGAGKSTQICLLRDSLEAQGYQVLMTREPGGCPSAEALRDLFIEHQGQNWDALSQAMLMFTARSLHVHEVILPALSKNTIVLCDRFTDSTRVYQGLAGGLAAEKLEAIKQASIGKLEPDLTLVFDLDAHRGLARARGRAGGEDSFESKDLSFHQSLREGYLKILDLYPNRCVYVDASKSIDNVSEFILANVGQRLSEQRNV